MPEGWRRRATITTGDTPHPFPTAALLPRRLGGVDQVERSAAASSVLAVPLAPATCFTVACGALRSAVGP